MTIGSPELIFKPSRKVKDTDLATRPGPWSAVYENGEVKRYESKILMPSPGSVTLILQAILPYVLLLPSSVPLRLTIQGGTNVSKSPSIDYTVQVLLPLLAEKLGLPEVKACIQKRGWSIGRPDVGFVDFDIAPTGHNMSLPGFDISERGDVQRIVASMISPNAEERETLRQEIFEQVAKLLPDVKVEFEVDEISSHSQRCYLLLVAKTSTGHRLGSDWLDERRQAKSGKKKEVRALAERNRQLVSNVLKRLKKDLYGKSATDEFLEDQLVVFQAIANGKTFVNDSPAQESTLHTQTARWVGEQMLDVRFGDRGECEGRGLDKWAFQGDPDGAAKDDSASLPEMLEHSLKI